MASEAIGPATLVADPGAGTLAMQATPTSRRPASQGLSPSAKRPTRREIVKDVGHLRKRPTSSWSRRCSGWRPVDQGQRLYGGYP